MRISDWSSDVCSSDLLLRHVVERFPELLRLGRIGEHDAAQYLRREVRQAGEADRRVLGQRVADAERAVIGDADDVAGKGLVGQLPVLGEEENRAVHRDRLRSEEHPYELKSLMRISYAVVCL